MIGLTSSEEKAAKLKERGFDTVLNYIKIPIAELTGAIIKASPKVSIK